MTKPTVEASVGASVTSATDPVSGRRAAPERWVDEPSSGADGQLGALFRAVKPAEPLSAVALARVHARLGVARRSSVFPRRVREAVLASVMLMAGSSLALAGWGVSEWWSARRAPNRAAPVANALGPSKHVVAPRKLLVPAATPVASVTPPEVSAPESDEAVAPRAATAKDAPLRAYNAADESALAAESLALQGVLVKLRREHDAQGALSLLDQSQSLFTHGALGLEAQVARVDALLLLGRQAEALTILNHLPLAHLGRGGELRLQRAELRARSDCGLALTDFDALTRQALAPALAERALYGRAVCEIRVADDSHAQSDLRDYLTRFPKGRFASQAHSQLARMPQKSP